jgi:16S rRNA (adenine1518-N6/adenine1519-N6)-dimethyltransferase
MTRPVDGHWAKKRFGQNFLHDAGVIAHIVAAIAPQPGDTLVEIGPGLGALTRPLLAAAGRLTVIEIDRDLVPGLSALGNPATLRVIEADALNVDYAKLAPPGGRLRLCGNLPYNISTPLLFHLLAFAGHIDDMHFMLQKEVVDRMCAGPGEDAYGRLSAALAARCDCEYLFSVGPGAFRPAPQVDSAIVRLRPRPPGFVVRDWRHYDRVLLAAFNQRRKTLSNSLKPLLSPEQIRSAGIDPALRPERLSPAQFAALANLL